MVKKLQCTDVTRSFEICINFKREINDKKSDTMFPWPHVIIIKCKKKLAWIGDMYTEKKVSGICQVKLRSEDGAN